MNPLRSQCAAAFATNREPLQHWQCLFSRALLRVPIVQNAVYIHSRLQEHRPRSSALAIPLDTRTLFPWPSKERAPEAQRFGERGKRAHTAIAPHLARIARLHHRLDSLAVAEAIACATLDSLQATVLVVDQSRCVWLLNAHGVEQLASTSIIGLANQRLVCKDANLDSALGHIVMRACSTVASGGALPLPNLPNPASLLLNVVPIPAQHDLAGLRAGPLALVVIADPASAHLRSEVLQHLFGLSHAEAALMAALASGSTVAEFAHQRGVSVATVRTELSSLFGKTGVDTQARLVALAKTLPSTR